MKAEEKLLYLFTLLLGLNLANDMQEFVVNPKTGET
jgi:hypothetical protein